jgi:hypothetical protein
MRVSHKLTAVFDDPNLVSVAGLAPVMALAERAGLHDLVAEHVTVPGSAGANAAVKIPAVLAGMVAGADSISDLNLLRHGGMGRLFDGMRAPTTLGTFLRAVSFGHVRQFDAVASRLLIALAKATPGLAGADQVTYVDVDETHGYAKQGTGYGYSGVKGLNALVATVSTPLSAPVIAATRLRRGATNSAKGAFRLIGDALATARQAGAGTAPGGLITVRADSAFYNHKMVAAARRGGARFSITARMDPAVRRAIAAIGEDAWTAIKYPNAIWEEDEQRWISDAEVAEIEFTAFTSRRKAEHVPGRLIVRRVKRLNPASVPAGQTALFGEYRHHAVFTDSELSMLAAEAAHRDHAIVEQVIAELKAGPLAHLPSGKFTANAAWLVLAAMAFNLTRAAGSLAGTFHAKARTATIRAQLINIPARIASSARRLRLHLPRDWPWQTGYDQLFTATLAPPGAAAA